MITFYFNLDKVNNKYHQWSVLKIKMTKIRNKPIVVFIDFSRFLKSKQIRCFLQDIDIGLKVKSLFSFFLITTELSQRPSELSNEAPNLQRTSFAHGPILTFKNEPPENVTFIYSIGKLADWCK